MERQTSAPTCDAEFCSSDADLIFESSDRVRFHIHRRNLETHTGAFSAPEFESKDEVTYLTEPAKVLRILFQFVYPRLQPDLGSLGFGTVAAVSEAVEKYEVYSAMTICNVRMRQFIPDYAVDVFVYAIKHDYPSLVNQIAPTLLTKPVSWVIEKLPFESIAPWVKYHEAHSAAFERVLEYIRQKTLCGGCMPCYFRAFSDVQRIKSFTKIEEILAAVNDKITVGGRDCGRPNCLDPVPTVRSKLKTELKRVRVPKFRLLQNGKLVTSKPGDNFLHLFIHVRLFFLNCLDIPKLVAKSI